MNMIAKGLACLTLLSSASLLALSSGEKTFIDAVRDRKLDVIERWISVPKSQEAWDKALRAAARNKDFELVDKLYDMASRNGVKRAREIFDRSIRKAGREQDFKLYNRLVGYASFKHTEKARKSLVKRYNKNRCPVHKLTV